MGIFFPFRCPCADLAQKCLQNPVKPLPSRRAIACRTHFTPVVPWRQLTFHISRLPVYSQVDLPQARFTFYHISFINSSVTKGKAFIRGFPCVGYIILFVVRFASLRHLKMLLNDSVKNNSPKGTTCIRFVL